MQRTWRAVVSERRTPRSSTLKMRLVDVCVCVWLWVCTFARVCTKATPCLKDVVLFCFLFKTPAGHVWTRNTLRLRLLPWLVDCALRNSVLRGWSKTLPRAQLLSAPSACREHFLDHLGMDLCLHVFGSCCSGFKFTALARIVCATIIALPPGLR